MGTVRMQPAGALQVLLYHAAKKVELSKIWVPISLGCRVFKKAQMYLESFACIFVQIFV